MKKAVKRTISICICAVLIWGTIFSGSSTAFATNNTANMQDNKAQGQSRSGEDLEGPTVTKPDGFEATEEAGKYVSDDKENPLGKENIMVAPVNEVAITYTPSDEKHQPSETLILDPEWEADGTTNIVDKGSSQSNNDLMKYVKFVKSIAFNPYGYPEVSRDSDKDVTVTGDATGYDQCIAYVGVIQNSGNEDEYDMVTWVYDAKEGIYTDFTYIQPFNASSNNFDWWDDVSIDNYSNFLSITAGDYDGDGKDSYIIYTPDMVYTNEDDGRVNHARNDSYLREFTANPLQGGAPEQIKTIPIVSLNPSVNNEMWSDYDYNYDNELRRGLLSVDVTTGDFDGDRKDELATVSGLTDLDDYSGTKNFDDRATYLTILEYAPDGGNFVYVKEPTKIEKRVVDDGKNKVARTRFNSIDNGDIDGDGLPEIITVGMVEYLDDDDLDRDYLEGATYGVSIVEYEPQIQDYNEPDLIYDLDKEKLANYGEDLGHAFNTMYAAPSIYNYRRDATSANIDNEAPTVVRCVATNGIGAKEQIFLDGVMWTYNSTYNSTNNSTNITFTPEYIDPLMSHLYDYMIDDAVAANYYDTSKLPEEAQSAPRGAEQIVFSAISNYAQTYNFQVYEVSGTYTKNDSGVANLTGWSRNDYNEYSGVDGSDYFLKEIKESREKNTYVSLAAVDIGDDSSIGVYVDKTFTQTGVRPSAVLLGMPTFEEGLSSEAPGWVQYSEDSGASETESSGYSGGGGLQISGEFGFFGSTVSAMLQGQGESGTTSSGEDSKVQSLGHYNFGSEHYVVIYSNGLITYSYLVWDSAQKKWVEEYISVVSDKPSYSEIKLEDYNDPAFLDKHKLEKLDVTGDTGAIIDGKDPETYPRDRTTIEMYSPEAEEELFYVYPSVSSTKNIGAAESQSITNTHTDTIEKGYSVGAIGSADIQFGTPSNHLGGGIEVQGSYNWGEGSSSFDSNTKLALLYGTGEEYYYDWQLASWPVKAVNNNVLEGEDPEETLIPVIGFVLSDIEQPKDGPQNLEVSNIEGESNQLELKWDSVSGVSSYEVYRSLSKDGNYELVTTVDELTYIDNNLAPNTEYFYKVRGVVSDEKYSKYSEIGSATTNAKSYVVTFEQNISEAGSVTVTDAKNATTTYKSGDNITEGTEITVNVKENKGYEYKAATIERDGIEQVVQGLNPFNITITSDTNIDLIFGLTEYINPVIKTNTLEDGHSGIDYSQDLEVTKDPRTESLTYSIIDGALPDGLSINPNTGEISGVPTKAGEFVFDVHVSDEETRVQATKELEIEIKRSVVGRTENLKDITVAYDTPIEDIKEIPETVIVELNVTEFVKLPVEWDTSTYKQLDAGKYKIVGTIKGDFILDKKPVDSITTEMSITVEKGKITSVEELESLTVPRGASLEYVKSMLPEQVKVALDDKAELSYVSNVTWESEDYDSNVKGEYTFIGSFENNDNIDSNGKHAEIKVIVGEAILEISKFYEPDAITVPYGTHIDDLQGNYLPKLIEADVTINPGITDNTGKYSLPATWNMTDYDSTDPNRTYEGILDTTAYEELIGEATSIPKISVNVAERVPVSVEQAEDITSKYGEDISSDLPTKLNVTYQDGGTVSEEVTWDTDDFDPKVSGTQVIKGISKGLATSMNIHVSKATFTSVEGYTDKMEVTWGIDFDKLNLDENVTVAFDENTTTMAKDDLNVTWYKSPVNTYSPFKPGTYTMYGVVQTKEHYINGMDPKILTKEVTVKDEMEQEYRVTFDDNGGDGEVEPKEAGTKYHILKGSTELTDGLPTVTRNDYHFLGWYDAVEGGNKISEYTLFTENTTVYARWIPISDISFFSTGGEIIEKNQSTSVEKEPAERKEIKPDLVLQTETGKLPYIPTAQKAHKDLRGWYNQQGKATEETVFTADSMLVALWNSSVYTISFDSNGGTVEPKQKETIAYQLDSLPIPTRENHIFQGWYLGDERVDISKEYLENTTLTAKWKYTPVASYEPGGEGVQPLPTPAPDTTTSDTPETGDYSKTLWFVIAMLVSALGIGILLRKLRYKKS